VSTLWVLNVDSVAGSIMLLALSGLMLWTRLDPRRVAGLALALVSLGLAGTVAL